MQASLRREEDERVGTGSHYIRHTVCSLRYLEPHSGEAWTTNSPHQFRGNGLHLPTSGDMPNTWRNPTSETTLLQVGSPYRSKPVTNGMAVQCSINTSPVHYGNRRAGQCLCLSFSKERILQLRVAVPLPPLCNLSHDRLHYAGGHPI